MKKVTKMVNEYHAKCLDCNKSKKVYYTVSDFGDAPTIKKCRHCGELYWYTSDDETYIQSISNQLGGKKCEQCNVDLADALIETHKNIQCCGAEFSLDDDFTGHNIPSVNEMAPVEVYLIYS